MIKYIKIPIITMTEEEAKLQDILNSDEFDIENSDQVDVIFLKLPNTIEPGITKNGVRYCNLVYSGDDIYTTLLYWKDVIAEFEKAKITN